MNLIFANRSGLSRLESKETVKVLESKGARVKVYSCDVGDETQFRELVKTASQEMPPIRGVIQAAMVLRVWGGISSIIGSMS
jgi:KR domain